MEKTIKSLEENPLYFIFDCYRPAGRPTLEANLMHYAKDNFLNTLTDKEGMNEIGRILNALQEELYNENKRLKKVGISFNMDDHLNVGWFRIGQQYLNVRKVKKIII